MQGWSERRKPSTVLRNEMTRNVHSPPSTHSPETVRNIIVNQPSHIIAMRAHQSVHVLKEVTTPEALKTWIYCNVNL